jgi:fatty acid desaturase
VAGTLNAFLLTVSLAASWTCLWAASHLSLAFALVAAWLFSLINNTTFALMHEAVHGLGAKSTRRNDLLGIVAGLAFPTSFSMQRVAHMGHHQRNRTDLELYDYYLPSQSRLVRNIWLYAGNLLGLYWWSVVFSNLVFLLAPGVYRSRFFVDRLAPALGFGPYVADLVKLPVMYVWTEIALAFSYQALVFYWLDLTVVGVLACYWAFALNWSVLQYADHAWSARDVRSGAWNLKVLAPFRWIALNYHYHQAHHQHPQVPWYQLPRWVDTSERQPSFWRVYFSLWKGVRPAPPMGAAADLAFLFPSQPPAEKPANK